MSVTAAPDSELGLPLEAAAHDMPFHALHPNAILEHLDSSVLGITSDDAERRLALHGRNCVGRTQPDSAWRILWRQINGPLIWVLLASAALAIVLGKMLPLMSLEKRVSLRARSEEHRLGR